MLGSPCFRSFTDTKRQRSKPRSNTRSRPDVESLVRKFSGCSLEGMRGLGNIRLFERLSFYALS